MKKLFCFALALISFQQSYSQTPWQKGGNSNLGGPPTLGTNYAGPLLFKTSSINRMVIDLNGKVGIGGGLNPQHFLDVAGDMKVDLESRFMDRIYAGPVKGFQKAIVNIYDKSIGSYGSGAIWSETNFAASTFNQGNLYNTVIAIDNALNKAFTILNTTKPGGILGFQEYFSVFGNGNTHMGRNVQIGFTDPSTIDPNISLNIAANTTNNIGLMINSPNSILVNPFIIHDVTNNQDLVKVTGDGTLNLKSALINSNGFAHFADAIQVGYSSSSISNNYWKVNINSTGSTAALLASTTHPGGNGYNTLISVNHDLTKGLAIENRNPTPHETCVLLGNGSMALGGNYVPPPYMLAVYGNIVAEELVIKLRANWPDYVFYNKANLMSLDNLNEYINENHHLPNIPSADEIKTKGLTVGDMQVKQMEKIEELTLYVIELKKEIEALKKQK